MKVAKISETGEHDMMTSRATITDTSSSSSEQLVLFDYSDAEDRLMKHCEVLENAEKEHVTSEVESLDRANNTNTLSVITACMTQC